MCGIFGIVLGPKSQLEKSQIISLANSLFELSASRGKEATGITLVNKTISYYKESTVSNKFIKSIVYKQILNSFISSPDRKSLGQAIIGHSRLATNGAACDNTNNQPVRSGNVVGVHNGIIVNDGKIWQKFPQLQRKITLDTEAAFGLIDHFAKELPLKLAVQMAYRELEGAASLAFVHARYPFVILSTNTGSLYLARSLEKQVVIFASEWYIVNTVSKKLSQKPLPVKHVDANSGFLITPDRLLLEKFNLGKITAGPQKHAPTKTLKQIREIIADKNTLQPVMFSGSLNSLKNLKKHTLDPEAISRIRRCTRCILPVTMPLIRFDDSGVCSYCLNFKKPQVLGTDKLRQLLEKYQIKSTVGDSIVAFSGGRDSSYGLHLIKKSLKLTPVAYTYDWGMVTDLARRNQARITGKLGVEHIIVSANIKYKRANIRKNVTAWLAKPDLGMIPLFMAGDKQAEYYAEDVKRKTGIDLMIYCRGNTLENEEFKWGHCGIKNSAPKGVIHNLSPLGKFQLALYYGLHYLTNPAYINTSIIDTLFAYFVTYGMQLNFLYLWHYLRW
ncbi:MAG: hypothetical protein AAB874_06340, partial [Patescibacteria group bacterium]